MIAAQTQGLSLLSETSETGLANSRAPARDCARSLGFSATGPLATTLSTLHPSKPSTQESDVRSLLPAAGLLKAQPGKPQAIRPLHMSLQTFYVTWPKQRGSYMIRWVASHGKKEPP